MDIKILQEITEFNARRWWRRILAQYPSAGIMPKVRISTRLGNGKKPNQRMAQAEFGDDLPDIITMSAKWMMIAPDKYPDNIIPHELAHIAAYRVFGCNDHGPGWREVIKTCNIQTDIYV